MAITNGYATLAEVKAALRITDSVDDSLLENSIEAASRRIDGYCGRFFYQRSATVKFFPIHEYKCAVPDLASSTVTISLDTTGDGTYETVLTAGQYQLEPFDVVLEGRPYRTITAIGGQTFPLYSQPAIPSVQVQGTWGWPAIPDDVREACVLLSIRGFARYNAALGVVGFADMAIQVRSVDPDVRDLLFPYRLLGLGG
jgi:hypothetical protein